MTFEEALEIEVSRYEAEREVRRHNADPAQFFADAGERDWYTGAEVLEWLGY